MCRGAGDGRDLRRGSASLLNGRNRRVAPSPVSGRTPQRATLASLRCLRRTLALPGVARRPRVALPARSRRSRHAPSMRSRRPRAVRWPIRRSAAPPTCELVESGGGVRGEGLANANAVANIAERRSTACGRGHGRVVHGAGELERRRRRWRDDQELVAVRDVTRIASCRRRRAFRDSWPTWMRLAPKVGDCCCEGGLPSGAVDSQLVPRGHWSAARRQLVATCEQPRLRPVASSTFSARALPPTSLAMASASAHADRGPPTSRNWSPKRAIADLRAGGSRPTASAISRVAEFPRGDDAAANALSAVASCTSARRPRVRRIGRAGSLHAPWLATPRTVCDRRVRRGARSTGRRSQSTGRRSRRRGDVRAPEAHRSARRRGRRRRR